MDIVFLKPPAIDPAVWRPDIPLIVLERTASKEQLCVWIAVRWLMAAFPREKGFGTRKIAARAKVNQKYIARWCDDLIDLGLMCLAGEESIRGFAQSRPIYTIDLRTLDQQSSAIALDVLARWGAPIGTAHTPPNGQLDFLTPTDPPRDQTDPPRDQITDPPRDHMEEHGGGGGDHARTRESWPAIPTPAGAWVLPMHPFDLWADACDAPLPIAHLAALASEHQHPTHGCGWYWVGRAILAGSMTGKFNSVAKVRSILNRWRVEGAYGSDISYGRSPKPRSTDVDRRSADAGAGDRGAFAPAAPRPRKPRPGERGYLRDRTE